MKLAFALTDTALRRVKPRATPYKLADGGGLFAQVMPNGSMYWRFKYRFDGKEKLLALGQYPAVSLSKARTAHQAAKVTLQSGTDPSVVRQVDRAEKKTAQVAAAGELITFDKVADDWLATRVPAALKHLDQRQLKKASKTYARDERMVRYLKRGKWTAKGLRDMALPAVDLAHLVPLLKVVNHPTRAKLISTARKIVAYAKSHAIWPKDRPSPFADIDTSTGYGEHTVVHRPAITEPAKFGHLLRKMAAFEGRSDGITGYALELLVLTFVRPGTVAAARWAHFNLDEARWVVPFNRLKMAAQRAKAGKSEDDYIVPLSRQAVSTLRELHALTGGGEYLFPGRGRSRTISENTLNYAMHGLGYKGIHCAHGFRSTASTLLNRERTNGRRKFERELIEMQQDRLDASTRAIYDRDDRLPERIALMQFWADKVDAMRAMTNTLPAERGAA